MTDTAVQSGQQKLVDELQGALRASEHELTSVKQNMQFVSLHARRLEHKAEMYQDALGKLERTRAELADAKRQVKTQAERARLAEKTVDGLKREAAEREKEMAGLQEQVAWLSEVDRRVADAKALGDLLA